MQNTSAPNMGTKFSYAQAVKHGNTGDSSKSIPQSFTRKRASREWDDSDTADANSTVTVRRPRYSVEDSGVNKPRKSPSQLIETQHLGQHLLERDKSQCISKLEQDTLALQDRLRKTLEENEQVERRNAKLEDELRAAQLSRDTYRDKHEHLKQLYQAARDEVDRLKSQIKRQQQIEEQHRATISHLESQNQKRARLIEQRNEEVQVAKEFLNTQDGISGAEVVNMVRSINEQIFQISAAVADSIHYKYEKIVSQGTSNTQDSHEKRSLAVLERLLQTTDHGENPEIVQIALQNTLVASAQKIGMHWGDHEDNIQGFLNVLAESVNSDHNRAISRRWRAITHAHSTSLGGGVEKVIQISTEECFDALESILRFSGGVVEATMGVAFKPRISSLLRQMLQLGKVINQDVMSCEYVIWKGQYGGSFDAATMLDHELDEVNSKRGKTIPGMVVCTTALGLVRVTLDRAKENSENRTILLKPKVARDAYLQSIRDAIEIEDVGSNV